MTSLSGGYEASPSIIAKTTTLFRDFYQKNFFLLGMVLTVSFARLFPSVGKSGGYLRPELIIGKFGVTFVFLLSGLSLELSELKEAVSNLRLNSAIQLATFGAWPLLVGLPLTHTLRRVVPKLLPPSLLDGLLIMSCLPTTINMCIFLTNASGGSVATALCNAVISNIAGVFLTPALLLRFFGANIRLPFGAMIRKLCNMVLVPVGMLRWPIVERNDISLSLVQKGLGNSLRRTEAKHVYEKKKKLFKRAQELILLSIVWTAFCDAFSRGFGLGIRDGLTLLLLLPALHLGSIAALYKVFGAGIWGLTRGQIVAAIFCGSHKTLAFGLPLVNTVFAGAPDLAAYCAPIMLIHPIQLLLGSLLVPRLSKFTETDKVVEDRQS
eukprot:CAMPEP_0116846872 /NCGR_PEP_ID=MMETSP0418-20121206/14105_1 /TAXON_ID=1158023 /ORGANISM="Astrosyne radiata, Strain 13vi08-1A" /LENGTH=380 /DNA_ID=CAMNT_0004478225 /DNA_START=140 /DNA_END=1281 /DNA_ORIENTATION=-